MTFFCSTLILANSGLACDQPVLLPFLFGRRPPTFPEKRSSDSASDSNQDRGGSRGRVEGVATPPLGSFQIFHAKNNIISYNVSSSQIDHYKKTVAIPLLDSLIMQIQGRFSDEHRHASHLL